MVVVPVELFAARQRQRIIKVSLLSAAAVLLISFVALWLTVAKNPTPVARFEAGSGSAFTVAHTNQDHSPSDQVLHTGSRMHLLRGTMKGVSSSGVRWVIDAPCDLTVVAADRIHLDGGQGWFDVPSSAIGFTVKTEQLKIVDLGTQFGVVAQTGGGHEVHVIKGKVKASSRQKSVANQGLVLAEGEALRVDEQGTFHEILHQPTRFTTKLPKAISIRNHSFEIDRNTKGDGFFMNGERGQLGGELTAWKALSGEEYQVQVGWRDVKPQGLDPFPAPSTRPAQAVSLISGASLLNVTDTPWSSLRVGDQLTLTIALGLRTGSPELTWNQGTFFGLTDGDFSPKKMPTVADAVAHSKVISANPATGNQSGDGNFRDVSIEYTIREADLKRPGRIGILLVGSSPLPGFAIHQSFFDNVRLHVKEASGRDNAGR